MNKPTNPLSIKSAGVFLGFPLLTFAGLLSLAANVIQVVTIENGWMIFGIICVISLLFYSWRIFDYYNKMLSILTTQIEKVNLENGELKNNIRAMLMKVQLGYANQVRPVPIAAMVATRKFRATQVSVNVIDINANIIVIDKGKQHGIAMGTFFTVACHGNHAISEDCEVTVVDNDQSWLTHSGTRDVIDSQPSHLVITCIDPPDIRDEEKEIAEFILIADGFSHHAA